MVKDKLDDVRMFYYEVLFDLVFYEVEMICFGVLNDNVLQSINKWLKSFEENLNFWLIEECSEY